MSDYPLERVVERIDWTPFFQTWQMRGAFPDGKLNAMINSALDSKLNDEDELIAEIEAFRSARKATV